MLRPLPLLALVSALVAPIALAAEDVETALEEVEHGVSRGTPPQPERVADVFRRARPSEAETFRGLLVCSVRVPGETWDGSDPFGPVRRFMGRIDLNATIRLEGEVVARWYGPEDQSTALVAVPGTVLARGRRLTFDVEDRDVVRDDDVGKVTLVYDGSLPVRASESHIDVECRGIPEALLEEKVADAAEAADRAMRALPDASHPEPSVLHFRRGEMEERRAKLAVYDLARWVGLADSRVSSRLDELAERQRVFEAHVGEVVTELRERAAAPGTPVRVPGSPFSVSVTGLVCDLERLFDLRRAAGLDTPMTCALRVVLSHEASSPQAAGFAVHVVGPRGETTPAVPILVEENGESSRLVARTRLPRGAHATIFALETANPVLLRLSTRSGVAWARIEEATTR